MPIKTIPLLMIMTVWKRGEDCRQPIDMPFLHRCNPGNPTSDHTTWSTLRFSRLCSFSCWCVPSAVDMFLPDAVPDSPGEHANLPALGLKGKGCEPPIARPSHTSAAFATHVHHTSASPTTFTWANLSHETQSLFAKDQLLQPVHDPCPAAGQGLSTAHGAQENKCGNPYIAQKNVPPNVGPHVAQVAASLGTVKVGRVALSDCKQVAQSTPETVAEVCTSRERMRRVA